MRYFCKRCGFETDRRFNMHSHIFRKVPCEPALNMLSIEIIREEFAQIKQGLQCHPNRMTSAEKCHKCDDCGKTFASRQSKHRHMREKKCITLEASQAMVGELRKRNAKLTRQVAPLALADGQAGAVANVVTNSNSNNTVSNNTIQSQTNIQNQTNNVHIHLNNFGQENTEYISEAVLKRIVQAPFGGISALFEQTHLHPDHPENHNIKISNKKLPNISVYKNDAWSVRDKKEFLRSLVEVKKLTIEEHYEKFKAQNELTSVDELKFRKFMRDYEENEKLFYAERVREIELKILNIGGR